MSAKKREKRDAAETIGKEERGNEREQQLGRNREKVGLNGSWWLLSMKQRSSNALVRKSIDYKYSNVEK